MSTTSGASPTRNSYWAANDSAEVATSTWAWPGFDSWVGARQGTTSGQGAPSRETYFATFAARAGSLR